MGKYVYGYVYGFLGSRVADSDLFLRNLPQKFFLNPSEKIKNGFNLMRKTVKFKFLFTKYSINSQKLTGFCKFRKIKPNLGLNNY